MSFVKKIKPNKRKPKAWNQTKRKYTLLIAALSVLILATLTFGIVQAVSWFEPSTTADLTVSVSDFKGEMCAGSTALSSSTGYSQSQLSSLALKVKFTSKGSSAYIRVKMFESFVEQGGGAIPTETVTYSLADGWAYNSDDGYYYYDTPVRGNGGSQMVPFATGCTLGGSIKASDRVILIAQVETVQPDRAQEFFGHVPGAD